MSGLGLNKCCFIGNLGKDPELRFTPQGNAVASISIGVGSSWKDKQGVQQAQTEWISCVAFGKLAEVIGKYLKKGSKIYVEGRQKTEKYKGKDGQDKYSTKIVLNQMIMLDSKSKGEQVEAPHAAVAAQGAVEDFFNDEIPGFDSDVPF